MQFASDNSGPAAPEVMAALIEANQGYQSSYGADEAMARVTEKIRQIFEAPEAAVYLVATGTAANSLALATLAPPWSAIYCHRLSHIEEDECNAPEFFTGGAKLRLVEGRDAKMDPEALASALAAGTSDFVHSPQRGALSLTNVTERGAVYSVSEIGALAGQAKTYGLPVHLDGARFANAIVATNASPAEMTWKAGVDALSFGGTKNGLLGVEAVIFFDPSHAWEFELRRKRAGHLFSKHRYLSAQMEAYLANDLWLDLARKANEAAARLKDKLDASGAARLHASEANMIYTAFPRAAHKRLHDAGAAYYFTEPDASLSGPADENIGCRLVTNWSTSTEDIDVFAQHLTGAAG